MMPHDLPPWAAVYQQTQRWLKAGVFEAIVNDLRAVLRLAQGRDEQPTAVSLIVVPCKRVQKVDIGPATMEPSGAKAAKYIWLWIPWVICCRCMSRLPMSKIVLKWTS